jgi:hypothetical protein
MDMDDNKPFFTTAGQYFQHSGGSEWDLQANMQVAFRIIYTALATERADTDQLAIAIKFLGRWMGPRAREASRNFLLAWQLDETDPQRTDYLHATGSKLRPYLDHLWRTRVGKM